MKLILDGFGMMYPSLQLAVLEKSLDASRGEDSKHIKGDEDSP